MGYLVSTDIPNLISGISQQPWNVRLPTQAEEQVNCMSSVTDFLKRRPASKHIAKLRNTGFANGCIQHFINRDEQEKYLCLFTKDGAEVFDLLGNRKIVNTSASAQAYLASVVNPETDLRFLTINDYTFVLNRRKEVKMTSETSPRRSKEALVFIKAANYNTTYTVTLNGTSSSFTTEDGVAPADKPADKLSSAEIAENLANGIRISGFTVKATLNTIWIKSNNDTDFTVTATDTRSNTQISVFKNKVQRFSDLPTVAPNGYQIEITGDASSSFDNYYCTFEVSNAGTDIGTGVWIESVKPGMPYKLDASTMPHALVREADGTFSFKALEWDERTCGDEDSAPEPSFVGRTLNGLFFYRNRLSFLAGENVVMSETGEFFNFFPSTVTTMVDSDPIDVAASHTRSNNLEAAVVFAGGLVLFSEQCQFSLDHDTVLSASTVSIRPITEFEASLKVIPISSGKTVFFATSHGPFGGVREYITLPDKSEQNDATDISAQVPRYIQGHVRAMQCSTNEDILLLLSSNARKAIWVYKYFWNGSEKIQSAWFNFEMPGEVLALFFINTLCYLVMQYPDGVYLEVLDFAPGHSDEFSDFDYCIDRKITEAQCSIVNYDENNNQTRIKLPYAPSTIPVMVTRPADATQGQSGDELAVSPIPGEPMDFFVDGDIRSRKFFAGVSYRSSYIFSTFAMRGDAKGNAVTTGRLQLRSLMLNCSDTGFLKVIVEPDYRNPSIHTFTGRQLGHGSNLLGYLPLYTGVIRCPILAENTQVRIRLESESFLPFAVVNAGWEGFYNTRDRRQ